MATTKKLITIIFFIYNFIKKRHIFLAICLLVLINMKLTALPAEL